MRRQSARRTTGLNPCQLGGLNRTPSLELPLRTSFGSWQWPHVCHCPAKFLRRFCERRQITENQIALLSWYRGKERPSVTEAQFKEAEASL
mmetsp:Transcript_21110/g.50201  ORF Transcript_21110/g.50201 Transcript_21110/m.50201 type:complete len:91 (-) Transcript_21110:41-313(-)